MKLKKGDVVSIIAPSSAPKNKDWLQGVEILKDWGLKPSYSPNIISPWLYHAQSHHKREQFLTKAFTDSKSQAVWAVRGGYGLQKIMPALKKTKIKKKLFIGYSDSTALHIFLNGVCKIPSLHAPFLSDLPKMSLKELSALKDLIFLQPKGFSKKLTEPSRLKFSGLNCLGETPKFKKIKAHIVGGNLTILSTSLACPWFPKSLGSSFLFLEDVKEEGYKIDRYLHQLFFSGVMKDVKALLIGSFSPLKKSELENKILKPFSKLSKIPIITGLPCGHSAKNKALPLLTTAELVFFPKNKAQLEIKNF